MADIDQAVSAIKGSSGPVTQRWKEWLTGIYARTQAALVYGITTGAGSSEVPIGASTAGSLWVRLRPSTESVGFVSGLQTYPTIQLAVTTSQAYSSGDFVGAEMAFTGAFRSTAVMTGLLQSLQVTDKGSTGGGSLTFYFLDTKSTGTAPVNDAAFDPDDGDLGKFRARVAVSSGDYMIFTDNAVAFKDNLAIPIRATTGTSLYCWTRFLSTGVVYGTTGDVNVTLGILAD